MIEWDFKSVTRIEEAIPDEPSKAAVFFKKYWLFVCVPIFLAAAYFYIDNLGPKYRVTAKIELHGIDVPTAVNGLKSKPLISNALNRLPFQVSFYNDTMPQKEVYPDSVPVKLVFSSITDPNPKAQIEVQATNGAQVALTNGDTVMNYNYYETITEPYAKFKIIQNPAVQADNQTYIVKINDTAKQLEQVYKDLQVAGDARSNTLTVSLLAANDKKGVVLLNKLLELYNGSTHPTPVESAPAVTQPQEQPTAEVADESKKPDVNIAALRGKADKLGEQIDALRAKKASGETVDEEEPKVTSTTDPAKVYQEIRPLVRKPVTEYVQLPHENDIEDPDLNDEVGQYNEAQSYRHTLMDNPQKNKSQIDSINRRLMVLQSRIVQVLNADIKNTPAKRERRPVHTDINQLIQAKREALAQVNRQIEDAIRQAHEKPLVNTIVKRAPAKPEPKANTARIAALPVLSIIDKPENNVQLVPPNVVMIYGLALLAGLLIPLVWRLIVRVWKTGGARTAIGKEKLTETIHDIFAVKQID